MQQAFDKSANWAPLP